MIRFGPMSIVLLCGALYGVLRAAMLCFIPVNRRANRVLAALIAVLALYTVPYGIGYAGYYDAYPWLTYAPYKLTLAIGPLCYFYLASLSSGADRMPPRWLLHLLPALAQIVYYTSLFVQSLDVKNAWDASIHLPWIDPLETVALLASLCVYLALARRHARRVPASRSEWARNILVAVGTTAVFWCLLALAELAWDGLGYYQRFPFYLWLAMLLAYLGTEGYRQGTLVVAPPAVSRAAPAAGVQADAPDLAALGLRWRATILEQRWWRDPELSLAALARHLGTNATTLSRVLNEGLGTNFNEAINRMRIDAVLVALRQQDEGVPVLDIALAEGFNSKASFNRAFKLYTGETPTAYRRRMHAPGSASQVSVS